MATLNGSDAPVRLSTNIVLTAPGLVGQAQLRPTPALTGRSDALAPATDALDQALSRSGIAEAATVEIAAQQVPTGPATIRSADGRPAITVEVPALGPQRGQVLLLTDEQGVLSWHYPEPSTTVTTEPTSRGADGTVRFVVPRQVATTPPPATEASDRSLVTAVGKKLLSVLVYPILDPLIGATARRIAAAYEDRRRPYRVRTFRVGEQRLADADAIDGDGWRHLAEGPALLLVHGTFSTTHGGFAGVSDATLGALSAAYDGRVFAFDHPSLSVDPIANARQFLDRVPADVDLQLDTICHSRGGLVARALAHETAGGQARVQVRRIVFVGTPNAGTALADPKHMGNFVDRYTTMLNLLPPAGPASAIVDVLESVLEVVKIIGTGALGGLPGLASMDPRGQFLADLGANDTGAEHYAIAADFEPSGALLRLVRLQDEVVDRVFDDAPNDMVVPSDGVADGVGRGLEVAADRRLRFDTDRGVWHSTFFSEATTTDRLRAWLAG